jgi:hypothetical protein
MQINLERPRDSEKLNVLLIGNNPIDMSGILSKLNQINSAKIATEIAFDIRSIVDRLVKFKPNYILIDDNIGRQELSEAVDTLSHSGKTKNVPITVLKNSNYEESYSGKTVLDYILKTSVTTDSLYRVLKNSLRLRRTQQYLYKALKNRRRKLTSLLMKTDIK